MTASEPQGAAPLAIIAGGGSLPFAVADAVIRRGRRVVLFPLRGWADEERAASYPHHAVHVGQFGSFCRHARAERCHEVVFIGSVLRLRLTQIRFDLSTLWYVPRVIAAFRGGDNHLIGSLAGIFEREGFRLIGAHEVAPEILVPAGNLGRYGPSEQDRDDIARGLALLRSLGPHDVGQAVAVAGGHVLAVEAAEGTDHLLARVAELRRLGRVTTASGRGVLVKAPKPTQDRRFDLPAIGPKTVQGVVAAGLAGLAVVAGSTVMGDSQEMARIADREQVFVHGVTDGQAAPG